MKKCPKCGTVKNIALFHKDNSRNSGIFPWCKVCTNLKRKKFYYNKDKSNPDYRARVARNEQVYKAKYPEKEAARKKARKLPIKLACEQCGATSKLHRHHEDYTKPLEVLSLCVACHTTAHRGVIV